MIKQDEINLLALTGQIKQITYSHSFSPVDSFYKIIINVIRHNKKKSDDLIAFAKEDLAAKLIPGICYMLKGHLRTTMKEKKLNVFAHITNFIELNQTLHNKIRQRNCLLLNGTICGEPVTIDTGHERYLVRTMVAVNRIMFKKADYIPCILWEKCMKILPPLQIGNRIEIKGTLQSRSYIEKRSGLLRFIQEVCVNELTILKGSK